MADNVQASDKVGSSGPTFAADEIGGVMYPRTKVGFGADNSYGDVAPANPLPAGITPQTSGGLTMHRTISAASTNATSVKASAGQVYGIQVFNLNASVRYLKLYNKASAPTVGTDVPVKTILIPGNSGGIVDRCVQGLAFGTGIAFALTTGVADADTGAVAASEIIVNLDYA